MNSSDEGNYIAGLIAGAFAAFIGAIVWALISYTTGMQLGLVAIGIGFAVGFAVRNFGHGGSIMFSIMGAILAFLGCFGGNILSIVVQFSKSEGISYGECFYRILDIGLINILIETSSPITILIYGFGLYQAFKLSAVEPQVVFPPQSQFQNPNNSNNDYNNN